MNVNLYCWFTDSPVNVAGVLQYIRRTRWCIHLVILIIIVLPGERRGPRPCRRWGKTSDDPPIFRPSGTERQAVALGRGPDVRDECRLDRCRRVPDEGAGAEMVELVHYSEHAHDPEVKRQVHAAADLDVRAIAELNVRVGEAFAEACLATLEEASISPWEVDLIGSHGQTVYHHSGVAGALRATLQLGDGDVIAVRTGRYVISDFRARDIAAGGEGAPLSPVADTILFARREPGTWRRRVVLNLGGIANLTVLDDDPTRVFGFDTGPANAPLDRLARRLSGGELACDQDGRFARAGRVNDRSSPNLLENDPFLRAVRRNRPGLRSMATRSSPVPPSVMVATTRT